MVSLYQITNLLNGKRYFGKTSLTIERRWWKHLKDARAGHEWAMSRAIRKHGPENFKIDVLFNVAGEQEANAAEKELIASGHTNQPLYGYNNTLGGDGYSDPTPEFRARRAAALRSTLSRPEVKERMAAHRWGKGQPLPKLRSDIRTSEVVALYLSGKSPREIKKLLSFSGVYRRLEKAGVHIRTRQEVVLGRPRVNR